MTSLEFSRLSREEQHRTIADRGSHLCTIPGTDRRSLFYALDDFFVEVVILDGAIDVLELVAFSVGHRFERMLSGLGMPQ